MAEELTGVVQAVEYTHGGAGNQYTTIDGVRYVTYWDIRTRNWKEGDRVRFTAVERSLWTGSPKALFAENISKIEPDNVVSKKFLVRYAYALEVEVMANSRDEAADKAAVVDLVAANVGGVVSTDVMYIELESLKEVPADECVAPGVPA